MLRNIWQKYILLVGVDNGLSASEKSRIKIVNRVALFVSMLSLVYTVIGKLPQFENPDAPKFASSDLVNLYSIFFAIPVLVLNRLGFYKLAQYFMLIFFYILLLGNALTINKPFRTEVYLFPTAAMALALFNNRVWNIFFFGACIVGYSVAATSIFQAYPQVDSASITLYGRIFIAFALLYSIIHYLKLEINHYLDELEVKNSELILEKDEMEKVNYTKDKIFTIISHDLKSPINSLRALLGLLNDKQISEDEFKKATAGLEKQVAQLSTSLEELLTWSKAQLHGINPAPELIKLREAVTEVTSVLKVNARTKRIIITTSMDSNTTVFCDRNMLHSVITNLVSNAIKFTPIGGAISISSMKEDEPDVVCFQVEDTGVGIRHENIERILNPTELFTTRGTQNEKGTGLGLAMCAEFIQKNAGKLKIESEGGKGSRFIVQLPNSSGNQIRESAPL